MKTHSSLIQSKVIEKYIASKPIPAEPLQALKNWKKKIDSGELLKQSEVSLHGPFMQQIMVEVLGYTPFGQGDVYTIAREYGISKYKSTGSVDLALGQFHGDKNLDQIKAVFEIKGAKTSDLDAIMSGRHKSPVQQAWEYARDAKGCQWVLVTNYVEIRLYAIGETSLVYERFDLTKLTDPAEYERFVLCLHAENLLTGHTSDLLSKSHAADKDITDKLYADYKNVRETLITTLIADNSHIEAADLISPAQTLLDRMLFIAFSEDRGLIPDDTIKNAYLHNDPYNPRPIYENFKGLFYAIDKGNVQLNIPAYNGGLFAKDDFLDQLSVSDNLCEAFKNLAEYDFASEVSVTVLGHIFEQSIADLEELTERIHSGETFKKKPKSTAVSGKRKLHGVVYTPDNITAFIVENTLGSHLIIRFEKLLTDYGKVKADGAIQWKKGSKTELKFWYAWQETLQTIKIVDPACGSGAFLVAAFDYLHAEYLRTNDKIAQLTGQAGVFDLNKEILNNNLYGVDINEESIEISKLSLWLKTAERGKALTSLDSNLKTGNSLGFAEPVPGSDFCWQVSFDNVLQSEGFDVVLGNPPYVRQERFSEIKPWLETQYDVYHGVVDLYAYFFELGLKLLKPDGMLGYISSATFFKTGSGQPLRQYLSHQVWLMKVVDFGDIQIFEGVTTYPAILIFKKTSPKPNSAVKFLALKNHLPDDLSQAFNQSIGSMETQQLQSDSWQLEDVRLNLLHHKLRHDHAGSAYPTLKEVYGSPYRGILTGLNEAFIIDRQTRDTIVVQNSKSAELIKPFLEGKDLKKWHAQPRDLWLIAIPKFWTRQQIGISEKETLTNDQAWLWFSQTYSALASYLEPFAVKAQKRTDKGEFWWELRSCAYYDDFEKPKLCWGNLQNKPSFTIDEKNYFINAPSPIIATDDYLFLAGVLNSNVTWFGLMNQAIARNGGYIECKPVYINDVVIPEVSEEQKSKISEVAQNCQALAELRYAIERSFLRRMVDDLCPAGKGSKLNKKSLSWYVLDFKTLQTELKKSFKLKANDVLIPVAERNDWQTYFEQEQAKHQKLSLQLNHAETQLNQAVYQLFNITADEIAIIELEVK